MVTRTPVLDRGGLGTSHDLSGQLLEVCSHLEKTQKSISALLRQRKNLYDRGSLMVWTVIMEDGHTDLHVFVRGTMTN
ncbi:hypothetical protein TNCV_1996411 [Trichonephila clavipes]|uniref:Uncharacterized protein n=1 Tax=Trichonephila clavipes TaxID=2585209 RepID=A0A8X6RQC7_TRICX|nr:hypothetical protein TNCV_1996411 [Trichonephila clavipes]